MKKKVFFRVLQILFLGIAVSFLFTCSYSNLDRLEHQKEKSGVMIQAFHWSSADREKHSTFYKWYGVMSGRAQDLKNTFEYVWFPPPSKCPDFSPEGYVPTELNDLNSFYGTKTELENLIQAIKPAKAIADIVINHRGGYSSWGDFKNPSWTDDYYSICSDDEGFSSSGSDPMNGNSKKGALDTGEHYDAARDLDHTNSAVQNGIISWMNNHLKSIGFVGWRYDFVKGFSGSYVGQYNTATQAEFSVGEFWPTNNFSDSDPQNWSNQITNWINATNNNGKKSRAFDFVLKGMFQTVFSDATAKNYNLLANDNLILRKMPSQAVTFVDNHDTGSTQSHWPVHNNHLGKAYAMILTHPGYPSIAWQHYFTADECGINSYASEGDKAQYQGGVIVSGTQKTLRQHIDYLIELRNTIAIEYDSPIEILKSTSNAYAAKISGLNGSLVIKLGSDISFSPTGEGFSGTNPVYSGNDFAIWQSGVSGASSNNGNSGNSGANTDPDPDPSKVKLQMTVDVGDGFGVYFTGSFVEGESWEKAIQGDYADGSWFLDVTPPSGGEFIWKTLKGSWVNPGENITKAGDNFPGLTWESGDNHDHTNLHPPFNGGF